MVVLNQWSVMGVSLKSTTVLGGGFKLVLVLVLKLVLGVVLELVVGVGFCSRIGVESCSQIGGSMLVELVVGVG